MSNIIIRADGNRNIGLGHVMRCLSIADACVTEGYHVTFVQADNSLENLVIDRGYEEIILYSRFDRMADELSLWDNINIDDVGVVIIDSYYVTAQYLEGIKKRVNSVGSRLVYIDDVLAFPYPVDVIINYNVYASPDDYKELYSSFELPELVLGPTYAPLRGMFRGISHKVQPITVRDVLVSTGGSDELHLILELVRYIYGSVGIQKYIYHILIGRMNADRDEIHKLASFCNNIKIHENVFDMKSLITSVDLVISAAGSTLYEICACGVPLITYALADNQLLGAEEFERQGLAVNIGDLRDMGTMDSSLTIPVMLHNDAVERIIHAVDDLNYDYKKRCAMGESMQELVNGYGANRLVKKIV